MIRARLQSVTLEGDESAADEQARDALSESGAVLLRGALDRGLVSALSRAADHRYRWIEDTLRREGPDGVASRLPRGCEFVATASSLSLGALDEEAGFDVARGLATTEPLQRILASTQSGPFSIDLDEAWLRRQYAPGRYPPLHAPHSWHQDGALGHDSSKGPHPEATEPAGLLPVVTCWAPLGYCGRDAPGLEVIATRLDRLLAASELSEEAVCGDFGGRGSSAPEMRPGDVLLLHGGTLHRTRATPGMTRDRTSVELRAFPAGTVPPRLAHHRFSEPFGVG